MPVPPVVDSVAVALDDHICDDASEDPSRPKYFDEMPRFPTATPQRRVLRQRLAHALDNITESRPLPGTSLGQAVRACKADWVFEQEIYVLDQQVQTLDEPDAPLKGRNALVYDKLSVHAARNGMFLLHGCLWGHDRTERTKEDLIELYVRATPTESLVFNDLNGMTIKTDDLLPSVKAHWPPAIDAGNECRPSRLGIRVLVLIRQEVALPIFESEFEYLSEEELHKTLKFLINACRSRPGDRAFQDMVANILPDIPFEELGASLREAIYWSFEIQHPMLFNGLKYHLPSPSTVLFTEQIWPELLPKLAGTVDTVTDSLEDPECIWEEWLANFALQHETPSHMYWRLQQIKKRLRLELQPAFDRWTLEMAVFFLGCRIVRLTSEDVPLLVRVALFMKDQRDWLTTDFCKYLRFSCTRPAMIAFVAALASPGAIQEMDGTSNGPLGKKLFRLLFPQLQSMGPYFCFTPQDFTVATLGEYCKAADGIDGLRVTRACWPTIQDLLGIMREALTSKALQEALVPMLDASTFYFRHLSAPDIDEQMLIHILYGLRKWDIQRDACPEVKASMKSLFIAGLDLIAKHRNAGTAARTWTETPGLHFHRPDFEDTLGVLESSKIRHFLGEEDCEAYFEIGPGLALKAQNGEDSDRLIKGFWETVNPVSIQDLKPRTSDSQRIRELVPLALRDAEAEALLGAEARKDIKRKIGGRKSGLKRRGCDYWDPKWDLSASKRAKW